MQHVDNNVILTINFQCSTIACLSSLLNLCLSAASIPLCILCCFLFSYEKDNTKLSLSLFILRSNLTLILKIKSIFISLSKLLFEWKGPFEVIMVESKDIYICRDILSNEEHHYHPEHTDEDSSLIFKKIPK